MLKMLFFLKKNNNLTHDECIKHHREAHVPLVLEAYGLNKNLIPKRYIAYYLHEAPNMPCDLIVEQWFEDEDWKKAQEFRQSPAYLRVRQDHEIMLDRSLSKMVGFAFDQNVII